MALGSGDPRVGRVVGKYTLVRVVGTGGMATVYEARHRNGHRVAVKMLKPALAVTAEIRDRFLREGYAANKVGHPGAVRILDDDVTSDGAAFLVMELLEGETLDALAKARGGKLPLGAALALGKQLLEVLASAHEAGVVHRDIKPENVFVTTEGQVKVLDFGVARVLEPRGATSTATGRMLGTPAFMPPEQAYGRRDEIDARSDLWAAGATLFTALAGRVVHEAPTAEETLIKAATEPAPSLASVAPEVPAAVVALVDRSLLADRDARFASAREMLAALEQAHEAVFETRPPDVVELDGMVFAAPSAPAVPRRRLGVPVVAGVAAIAATAMVLGVVRRPAAAVASTPAPVERVVATAHATVASAPAPSVEPPPPPSPPPVAVVRARVVSRAPAPSAAPAVPPPPPEASAAPAPTVCGFEIDEEGRKWPRRCP